MYKHWVHVRNVNDLDMIPIMRICKSKINMNAVGIHKSDWQRRCCFFWGICADMLEQIVNIRSIPVPQKQLIFPKKDLALADPRCESGQ